jgi:hypothetical protein
MAEIKVLVDEFGIIHEGSKILPSPDLKLKFLEALAELEDNQAHKTWQFPKTKLHKVSGVQETIFRGYIDKISGWRLHVQYQNNQIHLKDIIDGQKHDSVIKNIQSKRMRYN